MRVDADIDEVYIFDTDIVAAAVSPAALEIGDPAPFKCPAEIGKTDIGNVKQTRAENALLAVVGDALHNVYRCLFRSCNC